MKKRPLILVTNDDGIAAPGIRALIEVMKTIGDVIVVAPDSPQSGKGHAVTIDATLFCNKINIDDQVAEEYSCSGTRSIVLNSPLTSSFAKNRISV